MAEVREALEPKVTKLTKERTFMASSGRWTQVLKELPANSGKQMQVLKEANRQKAKGRKAPTNICNKDQMPKAGTLTQEPKDGKRKGEERHT